LRRLHFWHKRLVVYNKSRTEGECISILTSWKMLGGGKVGRERTDILPFGCMKNPKRSKGAPWKRQCAEEFGKGGVRKNERRLGVRSG